MTIVGAGITGATIARILADGGVAAHVIETRDHLAGNCHTLRDADTGVLCHHYGPHIFHTDRVEVWDFVRRFAEFLPYRHRVLAWVGGRVYPLPINLLTLNQVFDAAMTPAEAAHFITQLSKGSRGESFEAAVIARIGPQLYEMFFKGYTQKQ
ncbi:MAG: NAD(P)-binding protein, partial [Cognatishimia sp.]|uniref:NAD(P)-binding protein n=1 Tax=Cognatishimia sp. TaxID=2211648 RepID=UPI0040584B23